MLPLRCYSDPAFFSFELDSVFSHSWLPVCRLDQVANPGDFFARDLFNEPVVVVRDREGTLRALSNVCRHRGRRVAEGTGNCGRSGVLVCPYHNWVYDLNGVLRGGPFMDKTANFKARDLKLPEIALDVWQGFVFVNFDANAVPLSKQLSTLDKVLEPFNLAAMKAVEFHDYPAPWNWKHTIENFSEAYHQPPIHPTTFEPWCPASLCRYDDVDGPYNLFWMPTANGGALPTAFPVIDGLPEELKRTTLVVNVFPYFHLLIDPACVVWLDMKVSGVHDHRNIWKLMVPPTTYALPDFEKRKKAFLETILPVWNEDTFACEGAAAGSRSALGAQGRLSWMEKSIHQFQNWLTDRYLGETKTELRNSDRKQDTASR
jgi:nitrite reductase/ring-hydroxylating ferredoxin subunit